MTSLLDFKQLAIELGRENEHTAVLKYLGEAMNYYSHEADDESKDIGTRLRQSLKATAISEVIQGIIDRKHRT